MLEAYRESLPAVIAAILQGDQSAQSAAAPPAASAADIEAALAAQAAEGNGSCTRDHVDDFLRTAEAARQHARLQLGGDPQAGATTAAARLVALAEKKALVHNRSPHSALPSATLVGVCNPADSLHVSCPRASITHVQLLALRKQRTWRQSASPRKTFRHRPTESSLRKTGVSPSLCRWACRPARPQAAAVLARRWFPWQQHRTGGS